MLPRIFGGIGAGRRWRRIEGGGQGGEEEEEEEEREEIGGGGEGEGEGRGDGREGSDNEEDFRNRNLDRARGLRPVDRELAAFFGGPDPPPVGSLRSPPGRGGGGGSGGGGVSGNRAIRTALEAFFGGGRSRRDGIGSGEVGGGEYELASVGGAAAVGGRGGTTSVEVV